MKALFASLLLLSSLVAHGQSDTTRAAQSSVLRPITSENLPTYGRYGGGYRTFYQYDGLDIHPLGLGPYIMASGDPDAIASWNHYVKRRQTGKVLIWLGAITAVTGIVMIGVARSDPNTSNPWVAGRPAGDGPSGAGGLVVGLLGIAVSSVGIGEATPSGNKDIRRAVQYYNRALNRRGISWQVSPYGAARSTGLALIGRF